MKPKSILTLAILGLCALNPLALAKGEYLQLAPKESGELVTHEELCAYYSKNYRELKPENMYLSYCPVNEELLQKTSPEYKMEITIIKNCLKSKQDCVCIVYGNHLRGGLGGYLHLYVKVKTGEIVGQVHYR